MQGQVFVVKFNHDLIQMINQQSHLSQAVTGNSRSVLKMKEMHDCFKSLMTRDRRNKGDHPNKSYMKHNAEKPI